MFGCSELNPITARNACTGVCAGICGLVGDIFYALQADENLRGKIEEPGKVKGHENDAIQQGTFCNGKVCAASHLQADDSIAQQKQQQCDREDLVLSELEKCHQKVDDQIGVIA